MGFDRFNVSTRISIGFGALIILSLALAGLGVYQLSDVGGEAGKMNALSANVSRVLDATRRIEAMRRAETRMRIDGGDYDDAKENGAQVQKELADAGQATLSEERRRTYANVAGVLRSHDASLDRFAKMLNVAKEEQATLTARGVAMQEAAHRLREMAHQSNDQASFEITAELEVAAISARVTSVRFQGNPDKAGLANVKAALERIENALDAVKKVASPDVVALIAPVRTALEAYSSDINSFATPKLASLDLYETEMRPQIKSMQEQLDTASRSLKENFDSASADSAAIIASAVSYTHLDVYKRQQLRWRRGRDPQRMCRLLDIPVPRDTAEQSGSPPQNASAGMVARQGREMCSLECRGWRQALKFDGEIEGFGPVDPFRTVNSGKRPHGDPGYPQRVGDNDAVQGLADQDAAFADRGEDRQRIVARVDQEHAGGGARLRPGAADGAFEVRHEADLPSVAHGHESGERQQRGRIAQAHAGWQTQGARGAGTSHPVDHPGAIQRGRWFVTAKA